jgi:hypothetical protein
MPISNVWRPRNSWTEFARNKLILESFGYNKHYWRRVGEEFGGSELIDSACNKK